MIENVCLVIILSLFSPRELPLVPSFHPHHNIIIIFGEILYMQEVKKALLLISNLHFGYKNRFKFNDKHKIRKIE